MRMESAMSPSALRSLPFRQNPHLPTPASRQMIFHLNCPQRQRQRWQTAPLLARVPKTDVDERLSVAPTRDPKQPWETIEREEVGGGG